MKTQRQKTLSNKIEGMIHNINIDKFIRKTLHLKKEKPSNFKLGKRGTTMTTPTRFEMKVIDMFS